MKSVFIRVESCFAVDFDVEEYVYHVFWYNDQTTASAPFTKPNGGNKFKYIAKSAPEDETSTLCDWGRVFGVHERKWKKGDAEGGTCVS